VKTLIVSPKWDENAFDRQIFTRKPILEANNKDKVGEKISFFKILDFSHSLSVEPSRLAAENGRSSCP